MKAPKKDRTARTILKEIVGEWERDGGDSADADVAFEVFPELLDDPLIAVEVIYSEYFFRYMRGHKPSPKEYYARYPHYETQLRSIFAIDEVGGIAAEIRAKEEGAARQAAAAKRQPPPRWPEPGENVGDLFLIRQLGSGSFSRVFLAEEENTGDRDVVVKFTWDTLREACTLGPLDHPNVVPVWSAQADPQLQLNVLRMPFLGEATLQDLLTKAFPKPGCRPPSSAAVIHQVRNAGFDGDQTEGEDQLTYEEGIYMMLAQLADALAFLHGRGIVHRDIKPSNVLLGFDGRTLLLDFNLASVGLPEDVNVGGTIRYMAPEQLAAWRDYTAPLPGPAADIFSFGTIAYQALTGDHPYGPSLQGTTNKAMASEMHARYRDEAKPISVKNSRVDSKLALLLQRCLAVEATHRPTAHELRTAFKKRLAPRPDRPAFFRIVATMAVLLCLSASTFLIARQLDAGEDAQKAYQRGQQLLVANKHAQARDFFSQAHQLKANGRALARMAYCDVLNLEHLRAFSLCNDAQEQGFSSARLYNLRGYILLQMGDRARTAGKIEDVFAESEKNFTEAIRLDPRLQAAYYNRAMVGFTIANRAGKTDVPTGALNDIRKALSLEPLTMALAFDAARLLAFGANDSPERRREALDCLERSLSLGCQPQRLEREPLFKSLHQEARFQKLLEAKSQPVTARQEIRVLDPVGDE